MGDHDEDKKPTTFRVEGFGDHVDGLYYIEHWESAYGGQSVKIFAHRVIEHIQLKAVINPTALDNIFRR